MNDLRRNVGRAVIVVGIILAVFAVSLAAVRFGTLQQVHELEDFIEVEQEREMTRAMRAAEERVELLGAAQAGLCAQLIDNRDLHITQERINDCVNKGEIVFPTTAPVPISRNSRVVSPSPSTAAPSPTWLPRPTPRPTPRPRPQPTQTPTVCLLPDVSETCVTLSREGR